MACACCQQILFEPRSSADAGSAADAGSNSYSFSLALTSLPIAAVSHTHTTKREWPMRSDDSLTHTAAGRRKRIGRAALVSTEQRQQPPRWPGNCLCVRVSKGGVANGNALAAATRLTHTHTRRQTGKLSDAMLQLTIFPNAINNRWLSLALLLPKNTKAAKKGGLGQKKKENKVWRRSVLAENPAGLPAGSSVLSASASAIPWLPKKTLIMCMCFFVPLVAFLRLRYANVTLIHSRPSAFAFVARHRDRQQQRSVHLFLASHCESDPVLAAISISLVSAISILHPPQVAGHRVH